MILIGVLKHLLPEFSGVDLPFALERNPPSGLDMGEPPGHSRGLPAKDGYCSYGVAGGTGVTVTSPVATR